MTRFLSSLRILAQFEFRHADWKRTVTQATHAGGTIKYKDKKFIDRLVVTAKAGHGGQGCASVLKPRSRGGCRGFALCHLLLLSLTCRWCFPIQCVFMLVGKKVIPDGGDGGDGGRILLRASQKYDSWYFVYFVVCPCVF